MIAESKRKCFLAAAETANFSAAAARLFISQQAVSKHIADLESELGVQLFKRDHHHVSLTKEGEALAKWLREFELSWEELTTSLRGPLGATGSGEQVIRIGYQNWMDFGTAPGEALGALRSKYPGLALAGERHAPGGLLDLLTKGTLDIVLLHRRFLPKKTAELVVLPLFETNMLLVCASENPLASSAVRYTDFNRQPLLMDRLEGETEEQTERRALREAKRFGFIPGRVIVVPNRDSIYTEAELNRGVFFGSDRTQTPAGLRLAKFPTGTSDTICCVRLKTNRRRRVKDYAEALGNIAKPDF